MTRSFRVGRAFGIDIEIDYTWFIIFALLVLGLSSRAGLLAEALPAGTPLPVRLLLAVVTALLFFSSVLIHELAHSVVALRHGMHISGITLFIFGGISKLSDEPRTPGVEFRMALAGPVASFVLAAAYYLLGRALASASHVALILVWLGIINLFLGIFNLLPGFPLDGGRVVRAGLWRWLRSLGEATRIASGLGQGLGVLMIVGGILMFFTVRTATINGLWMAFIGWFLIQAAQSSYQQVRVKQALAGVRVQDIMTRTVDSVEAECTLEEVVHEHVMTRSHPAYPVFDDGRLLGLLSLANIRNVPRGDRYQVTARQVVPPLSDAQTIPPGAEVWEALTKMTSGDQGRLLVMDDGRMVGIVSRTDIVRALRTRSELGAEGG